VFNVILRQ